MSAATTPVIVAAPVKPSFRTCNDFVAEKNELNTLLNDMLTYKSVHPMYIVVESEWFNRLNAAYGAPGEMFEHMPDSERRQVIDLIIKTYEAEVKKMLPLHPEYGSVPITAPTVEAAEAAAKSAKAATTAATTAASSTSSASAASSTHRPALPDVHSMFGGAHTSNPHAHSRPRDNLEECPEQAGGRFCDQWGRDLRSGEKPHRMSNFAKAFEFMRNLQHENNALKIENEQLKKQNVNAVEQARILSQRSAQVDPLTQELEHVKADLEASRLMYMKLQRDYQNILKDIEEAEEKEDDRDADFRTKAMRDANKNLAAAVRHGQTAGVNFTDGKVTYTAMVTSHENADKVAAVSAHHNVASAMTSMAKKLDFSTMGVNALQVLNPRLDFASMGYTPSVPAITQSPSNNRRETPSIELVISDNKKSLSEIASQDNIVPEARFFKNPQDFDKIKVRINTNDKYWPENFLDELVPEFARAYATRYMYERTKCNQYLRTQ